MPDRGPKRVDSLDLQPAGKRKCSSDGQNIPWGLNGRQPWIATAVR
jgi:hypothetical protein